LEVKEENEELNFDLKKNKKKHFNVSLFSWNSKDISIRTHFHFQAMLLWNREFDDDFKTHIEAEVPNLLTSDKNSVSDSLSTPVTYCELLTIVKSLPNGKSPSSDYITYEHIKFGGHTLSKCLC